MLLQLKTSSIYMKVFCLGESSLWFHTGNKWTLKLTQMRWFEKCSIPLEVLTAATWCDSSGSGSGPSDHLGPRSFVFLLDFEKSSASLAKWNKHQTSSHLSFCLSAERCEDAGDHQVHSSVPTEVLYGEPGEPDSAAQEPQSLPQSRGTLLLYLISWFTENLFVQ